MLFLARQYAVPVLVLFSLFVGAATVHPLVHTHAPGHTGCQHSTAHEHQHENGDTSERPSAEELPCDLNEAMASLAMYSPVSLLRLELVFVGSTQVTSLPATCRGAWGTFGGRGPPSSIS